jgi:hypothetical protein
MSLSEALTYWMQQGHVGFFPPAPGAKGAASGDPASGFDRFGKWQGVPRVVPKGYYETGPVDENGWPLDMKQPTPSET